MERMRWEMMTLVVPGMRALKVARMAASVAVSTADVESSSTSTFGCFSRARAMQRRCRWPPETLVPPWSMTVSYRSGKLSMNSSAQAWRHASRHSSNVASSLPQRRFSRMVPENSVLFCRTIATSSRRACIAYFRTSMPPTSTEPSDTSYRRAIRFTREDLPLPVPPMMPMVSPARMCRSMSSRA